MGIPQKILQRSKDNKDDEFYTPYKIVADELDNKIYEKLLKDKVIYCPCDTEGSNYVKYLKENKDRLGYKELIYTSLQEGYDFLSDKCKGFYEKADIVITNPPFSLLVKFLELLNSYNLKFLLLAPPTVYGYKIFFHMLKTNNVRLGFSCRAGVKGFQSPNDRNKAKHIGCSYITNLDIPTYKELVFSREYEEGYYDYIDGTDIINVNKTKDIPSDYFKPMSVPISFMSNYNPKQFEILDLLQQPKINGKIIFKRYLIQRKR